eukprot:Tbor_TRINITY_DN3858_c0_g1::TRINITY_DN3858_c0_g1_i1::g.5720::m.5720
MRPGRRVAVILCGSGHKDGSEISEAASLIIRLSQVKAAVTYFAPNVQQEHVINHNSGAVSENEVRNVLTESNRIARGMAKPLSELKTADFDALMFPGGFGVMKNLASYAIKGKDGDIRQDVLDTITSFHASKKPIGCACISPMLLARALGKPHNVTITLGPEGGDMEDMARGFGAQVKSAGKTGVVTDEKNKCATTAAYMYSDNTPAEVFEGISAMVDATLNMVD